MNSRKLSPEALKTLADRAAIGIRDEILVQFREKKFGIGDSINVTYCVPADALDMLFDRPDDVRNDTPRVLIVPNMVIQ